MQYKRTKGEEFPWLYIDFETLATKAAECGFYAELVEQTDDYNYLACITKKA